MAEAELGYAAGVVDSDGCVQIARGRNGRHHFAMVSVVNTRRTLVEWFQHRFGGSLLVRRQAGIGKRPIWRWSLQGGLSVSSFLRAIRPYLTLKSAQADVVLELNQRLQCNGKRLTDEEVSAREHLRQSIKALNRGVV